MTTETVVEQDDLGVRIEDAWSDEGCSWHIDFDGGAHVAWPWVVVLEWVTDRGNPHHADWATYTWQFYGETVDQALGEAVHWLDALTPWGRCGECGGEGDRFQSACGRCRGSGLTTPPPSGQIAATERETDG